MLFGEMLDDERIAGRNEGQKEMNRNWSTLISVIEPEDLRLLQQKPERIQEMLVKYHI